MGNRRIFDPPMTRRDAFGQRQRLRASPSTSNALWEEKRHREQHPASGMLGRRHKSGPALGRRLPGAPAQMIPEPPAGHVGLPGRSRGDDADQS
jgi:hypothetical protein